MDKIKIDAEKMDIIEELKKRGIPFKIEKIEPNPKIEKAVRKYVMKIEEGHKRAANSKLFFKSEARSPCRAFLFEI